MRKPNLQERKEIRRLVLEKLVMGRNWGMNYVPKATVPRGLPKRYSTAWYYFAIEELIKEGLILPYKKSEQMVRLNIGVKDTIFELLRASLPSIPDNR